MSQGWDWERQKREEAGGRHMRRMEDSKEERTVKGGRTGNGRREGQSGIGCTGFDKFFSVRSKTKTSGTFSVSVPNRKRASHPRL